MSLVLAGIDDSADSTIAAEMDLMSLLQLLHTSPVVHQLQSTG